MKVCIVLCLAAVALAAPRPDERPLGYGGNSGSNEAPMPYQYRYEVVDGYTRNYQGKEEEQTSSSLSGEYRWLMPDGRLQVVKYYDNGNGLIADVSYLDGTNIFPGGSSGEKGYSRE